MRRCASDYKLPCIWDVLASEFEDIQQQLQCLHAPLLSSYVSWGSATFCPLIDAGLLVKKVLDNLLVVVPRHAEQKDLKRKIPVRWTLGQSELGNTLL